MMVPSRTGVLLLALAAVACGDALLHVIEGASDGEGGVPDAGGSLADGGSLAEGGGVFGPGAQLAVYWGQDRFGHAGTPPMNLWEKPLADTCTNSPYDVVLIAYVLTIASGTDGTPTAFTADFANHCANTTPLPGSGIPACDEMVQGIRACHSANKKVLISIGGAGDPGLAADLNGGVGVQAAHSMWNMFLGGDAGPRPFGPAPLDGVDLDYSGTAPGTNQETPGYSAFVAELRALMTASGSKYYITAAPQCAFPDSTLGPFAGPIQDHPGDFDALFVKFFYEQGTCDYGTPDGGFLTAFHQWAAFVRDGPPKIFVGLPASPDIPQAGAGYVYRGSLPALVTSVNTSSVFGGIMLLDVSYDQNSAYDSGTTYGQAVKAALP
jgi:chitinase